MKLNFNPNVLRSKAFEASFKAAGSDGAFSGYGSVFGVEDSYGEIVAKGAFTNTLLEIKAAGRSVPVLWQHQTANPIGNWTSLEEDDTGLKGDGQLWLAEAPQAVLAHKGMTTKAITGLSIGYYVKKYEIDEEAMIVTLTEVKLVEISIVTSPANDEARVEAVKAKIFRGEKPTKADIERCLREVGVSKREATKIVSRGMNDGRSDSDGQGKSILTALRGFTLP